ncbi:MAG TPA: DnaB-like helicase C-terminal domain-containing protein [Thermomicrobiaceae bacterium]|nr:DnaB-like helicase C-terminal domain-containing protein [Thermomicrobiaceae bacterium]
MLAPEPMARAASEVGRQGRRPLAVEAVLADLDRSLRGGDVLYGRPMPTGFAALDLAISGGLKPGELLLIGGGQGIGKTTMTLQMARNLAAGGARVLYVCYEHDERFLVTRLLAMESRDPDDDEFEPGIRLRDVLARIEEAGRRDGASLQTLVTGNPALGRAAGRVADYADRLLLLRGSGSYTDLSALAAEVASLRDGASQTPCVLFLDYLQKVPVQPDPPSETERVTRVVEGLKDLALSLNIAVVAIVAAEKQGLEAPRLRLHHLRGGSAILYEADVILILNEKHRIVTRQYLTYNQVQAQALHNWVVCSIEKNRAGRQLVDLEFRKRFEYACFDPDGGPVTEILIDERVERD